MRLTLIEITGIRAAINQMDPKANIFLFGSRTDDNKRGGDIDLLVESSIIVPEMKRKILLNMKEKIGDQKIDLILSKNLREERDAFIQSILSEIEKL